MSTHPSRRPVRVYLCECGSLLGDALDLEAVSRLISAEAQVDGVATHPTLCSEEGQAWMQHDLETRPAGSVVVAACSPREHRATFMNVCRRSGGNPYLLALANLREQCAWVTPDKAAATRKAVVLTRAAIARASLLEPIDPPRVECRTGVLVIGAGLAGMTAARLLAEAGRRVTLVERAAFLGGRATLLSDISPTGGCASCMVSPVIDEVAHHPDIEVLTDSEIASVLGYAGNYTVTIKQRARRVDAAGCMACRTCHEACPVELPRELDGGLSRRKAIYIPYEGAQPHASLIDDKACLRSEGRSCEACASACPFGNINLEEQDRVMDRTVGAIVIATGAESRGNDWVSPSSALIRWETMERMLTSSGPTAGQVRVEGRPIPRRIALLRCTDAQGVGPVESCSGICCSAFDKYSVLLRKVLPDCEIVHVLWERCFGGKGARQESDSARGASGSRWVRLDAGDRIARVDDDGAQVHVMIERGESIETLDVDLAVIAPPLGGADGISEVCRLLRVASDGQRFIVAEDEWSLPFRTRVAGVVAAGGACGPVDLRGAAAQGAAAAGSVLARFVPGRLVETVAETAFVAAEHCGGCRTCVVVCPYGAARFDAATRVARVDQELCRGCGACAAGCPTGAMHCHYAEDQAFLAEMRAISGVRASDGSEE